LTIDDKEIDDRYKKRVLIVDDEPYITRSFSLTLEDSGLFEVIICNDPLVALSDFRPNSYDLLLLDVRMPGMNGFELYDEIKKIDNKVKVCFISAYDADSKVLKKQFPSLDIECLIPKNFIRKPIEISKLIERLEIELLT
jgi:CheY-like chemotaxis protein